MAKSVKRIPEGYHTVTPYLMVEGSAKLLDFVRQAFGAKETFRSARPDGTIMHAEVRIGDSIVMMGDPREGKPMPGMIHLYVDDTDATYQRALEAGATSIREPEDQFYGDRSAGVEDPVGNHWWLATHIEDVSPEEITRRAQALAK